MTGNVPTHRILGVLGGMGPAATARFYQDFVAATPSGRDQDHPRVVIDSDPAIPDRTDFLLGRGPDPRPRLVCAAKRLRSQGAGAIVMPCNTASVFIDELVEATSVLFISWVGEVIETIRREQEPPVGILATSGTIEAGLYQNALTDQGIDHMTPDDESQEQVMRSIYGPHGFKTKGVPTERAISDLLSAAGSLAEAGAQSLVLGCTELPLILDPNDGAWPVPVVDPAPSVIRSALAWTSGDSR
jgi:aspartate racemase